MTFTSQRALGALIIVCLTALTAQTAYAQSHYVRPSGQPRVHEDAASGTHPRGVRTPPPTDAVRLEVGTDFQQAIDSHAPGTTFLITAGTHREQSVVAKDGMRFIGEPGAIMSGARVLPASDFQQDGGHWWVGGQTQEGDVRGTVEPGFEANVHPEDLWVGDRWYTQVLDRSELAPGSWYFDYASDRIYLAEDPATLPQIETSVEPFAFGGWGVEGVLIENVTVTRYATPSQFGAIGGDAQNRYTHNWHVRFVTAVENHAWGILMGPGMMVHSSIAARNGQGGIAGNGTHEFTGYAARTGVYDSEIVGNNTLHYDWIFEGGGTKFSGMTAGMDFVNNHSHGNDGPGLWFDIYNEGVNIESNLIHDNTQMGILYELSVSATIKWNEVHSNSTGTTGPVPAGAIDVSQSRDVYVYENLIYDSPSTIHVRHDGSRTEHGDTTDVEVYGNDVQITEGLAGMFVENEGTKRSAELWYGSGNEFHSNTFRVPSADHELFSWGTNFFPRIDSHQWRGIHPDTVLVDSGRGSLPAGAVGYADRPRGAG